MKKRILALLLAVVMLLGIMPVSAFAAEAAPLTGAYLDSAGQQALSMKKAEENLSWNHYGTDMSLPLFQVTVPAGTEYIYVSYSEGVTVQNVADYYKDGGLVQGQMNMPEKNPMLKMPMADVLGTGKIALLYGADWAWIAAVEFVEGEAASTPAWPFRLSVDGQNLEVTDLGTTVECTKMYNTAKQMEITVPAGTKTVVVNGVNGALYLYPDHGAQKLASPGSNTAVTVSQGSYLCMKDVIDGGWYHVAVKFAPCESHAWIGSTCSAPKTCSVCGETEGEADSNAHSYVSGTCEYCGEAEPVAASYTLKLSDAKELTAGLNYFISIPAEGKDIIFDFGNGTISGAMCQRHCSKRNFWTAGEGSTLVVTAENVQAHLCNETRRAQVAENFDLELTEGSQMFAFYWWTTANTNGSYIYIEILPEEKPCNHSWNDATCSAPKTCTNCGKTEGEKNPQKHKFEDGACIYCGNTEGAPTPFSQKISVPANGDSTWGNISGLTLSGTDGSIYEAYWSKTGNPYVLDVVLGQDTDLDATITAEFSRGGSVGDGYKPTISGTLTVTLVDGKGTITMHAKAWNNAVFYPNTDWTINLTVDDGSAANRPTYEVELPTETEGYTVTAYNSESPVIEGRQYSFKITIDNEYKKGENFKVMVNGEEITSSGDTYTISNITEKQVVTVEGVEVKTLADKNVTVIVPAGATVSSGYHYSYFKYDFCEPLEETVLEDGRIQKVFKPQSGRQGFIRVQHPDGVTYWDFDGLTAGKVIEVTEEMLFIGSSEFNKETVYANFEKNNKDKADLYLTANEKGWLDLKTGDTWNLNVFRNFLSLGNTVSNDCLALPDVEYKVISVNGGSSDVISVTPNENNSSYAEIKAEKPGTAIILVSYDAVYNADGEGGKQWSAIWPENTGVIIVTVDGATGGITTNMTVNEEANSTGKQVIDAEHDILFYVGNSGASYSFKPETGCTVTVNRSSVGSTMTFSGFSGSGVEVADDGTVTVGGLTTGTHIIKVEKGGNAVYQVVRARQVSYEVKHSDGTLVTEESPAEPGESITVQFHGLVSPMEKLSGVYNANFGFWYNGEDGTEIRTSGGTYGVYNFSGSPGAQKFSFTLPATWSEESYTLTDGAIKIGGFGSSAGAHRTTTYIAGKEVNTNASGVAGVLAVLPDIAIAVNGEKGAEIDESIRADIFDSTTDGTGWGRESQAYVDKLTLVGAQVQSTRWDGDTCYVELVPETATDVDLGLVITYAAPDMPSWINNLSGTLNGEALTAGELVAVKLEDGTCTVEVYVIYGTIAKYSGTKTFRISIGEEMQEIPVESVALDKASAELEVGQTLTLTATVDPDNATDKTVTWVSSDETVATVENGVVTAVAAGEAVITAKAGDKEATCAVTVKTEAEPKEGINIVTGEAVSSNFDIRVSNIHIGVAGEVVSNTISTDGKVTVQLAEDVEKLDITLSMFAKKGMVLTKGAVAFNNGTPEELENVDQDNNLAIWTTEVTPVWTDGEMEIPFTVGVRTSSGWKTENNYTLTLKKAENTSGGEEDSNKVKVYLSMSHDADFMVGEKTNLAVALREVSIPWFDLGLYGMEEYTYEEGKPTVLHLYIYATELYYCGLAPEKAGQGYLYEQGLMDDLLQYEGSPGSIYFLKFWGQDSNLNYYVNYKYPAKDGWGITADQLVLTNNDIISVGHFTDWSFYGDSASGFNYLDIDGENLAATVQRGEKITLKVCLANGNLGGGTSAGNVREEALDVYYAKADALTSGVVSQWNKLGTTDSSGKLNVTIDLEAGTYVMAVAGQVGMENPQAIVSAPGSMILNVLGSDAGDQARDVIDLIDAIGEVTLDSEVAIAAARNAYDTLSGDQKAAVTNYTKLTDAEAKLAELKQAKADQDAADSVIVKMNAIGTVSLESKEAIEEARTAYDALTDTQKALISAEILKKLTDAETAYAKLIADEADKAAAKAVEDKISAIGTVTVDSEQEIAAAWFAYDALTDTQKQLVGNYEILTAAEKKLIQLKDKAAAEAVEAKIAAIGTVTLDSEEKIKAARDAYNALTDAQKALVENISVLEAAEEALELLKLAGTDITDIYKTTGDYLAGLSAPIVGATNGEWRVIGLARAGRAVPDSYYDAVVEYVKNNIAENGRLHASKSTDNSRLIVALTAIGKDVTNVDGYDLLKGLNDMTYIGKQGINGTIWALIAFDAHDYEIPSGNVTREKLVDTIVAAQLPGGGWALGGTVGDPDMTGMALQALAPYYNSNTNVKNAVDKALTWLGGIQSKDGTFTCSEGVTSESLAQVITGLTALGINPETDSRFIKNGVSAVDALSKFYVEGGGFKHGLTGNRNMMATEQGYYALVSYYRLLQGKTSLYEMSDVTIKIPAYQIIEGANSDWQKDDAALIIRADGEFAKFTGVKMDGVAVEPKHYTAKAGSTIVTFTTDYLKTLSEGDHTITVTFTDGEASTSVSILPTDEEAAKRVMDAINAIGTVTDDSGDKIKAAKEAYDKLTVEQKKLVTNAKELEDAISKYEELVNTVSVSFTLLGCYKHDSDVVHTLSGGNLSTWIAKKTYKVEPGATVKDVLEMALKDAGMSCKNPTGNYVESINGIGEFTNGSNSGWMYTLNGVHPGLGVAEQSVKNGDVIVFHYTDDYTKEKGGTGFGEDTAIQKVEDLIDAIGTVTLSSKSKIDAARKAYDALTYAQKQQVENNKKLTDAEAKYAELKKADDEKKANAVEALIDKIDAEIILDSEAAITTARKAYDALSADQKKLVGNYKKLTDAEYDLAMLKADEKDKEAAKAVEKLIDAIGTVTTDSEGKIKAAREAYDGLTDMQKALVKNYEKLENAEAKLAEQKKLADVDNAYKATGDYLENLGTPTPGSIGGEWLVIGLLRSGRQLKDAEGYYDAAVKFVQENIDENGRLHNAKSTENARMILALTAMGRDVTDVGGYNLLTGLNNMEYVQKQGINGPIWALLALDSGNYPAPGGDVTREALIQMILDAQLADGGWALSGSISDPDMTGMALQALAPYYTTNADVKKAADEAIEALSMMQAADGSFASIDGSSSESVAQVITALSALGIDADTDARFIKNGNSALDALYAFFVEGGGFKHIPNGKLDGMATEQSYYALAAYFRMLSGETALFDMTDVVDMSGDVIVDELVETLPVETAPVPTEPVETPNDDSNSFPWWLVIVIVVLAGAIVVLVIISKSKKGSYVR